MHQPAPFPVNSVPKISPNNLSDPLSQRDHSPSLQPALRTLGVWSPDSRDPRDLRPNVRKHLFESHQFAFDFHLRFIVGEVFQLALEFRYSFSRKAVFQLRNAVVESLHVLFQFR